MGHLTDQPWEHGRGVFTVFDTKSHLCNPGWSRTCYLELKAGLQLIETYLPLFPKYWD